MIAESVGDSVVRIDEEMTEFRFLFLNREAVALERLAQRQGLTVAELVRVLVRKMLAVDSDSHCRMTPEGVRNEWGPKADPSGAGKR